MALSSDPYEQRLFQMFQAHDVDSCGRLDRDALVKLCHTLELKERGHLLVRCLLGGSEDSNKQKQKHQQRVTFKEFREGLLHILGGEEQQQRGGEGVPDSSDGQQIVTTGSPTSSTSSASITSSHNTSKHLHLPSHHSYQQQQQQLLQHHNRKSESKKLEPVTESVVVNVVCSSNCSSIVPSGEDDLGTSTPVTTTPSKLIINTTDNDNEESSDREVSPKFVVGTKKYGRRSRPRQDCNGFDTSSDFSNSDNESVPLPSGSQQEPTEDGAASAGSKSSSKVQRSASQSDIHGSKRRRPPMGGSRLKRCASLPTHRQRPADLKLNQQARRDQLNMEHDKIDKKIYFMKLSENLREIWDSLVDNGHGDLLNQAQLEVVCERVGLQKLPARLAAREVFLKLSLQPIEGISFDEFISLLQSNSDILPITNSSNSNTTDKDAPSLVYDESDNFKVAAGDAGQELDRDSVEETVGFTMRMPVDWTAAAADIGSLAATIIADMWESAGIAEPRQLLHELGFYGEELQVADLVAALDDEQQRLGDGSDTSVIVRASLALHKAEVAALRQAFVQLVEENKKLYSDNKEVNHRATLLAQEVDERHNSLENSTRAKIRLLEQRHHETVKELTSQLAFEREQLSCANAVLEKRIQALEAEDGKSKAEIGRLSEENDGLRTEQENLVKELTELLEKNIKLNKDIAELEENNRNDLDDGFERKDDLEVLELIEKISILQDENTQLRDKNDEFTAEIESLNLELAKFKLKRSGISRTSSLEASPAAASTESAGEESSSAARKRQGDSPSKARLSDESPRLGKFRKCSNDMMENESDSSGDWMALQSELGIRVDSGITSSGISQDYSIVSESSGKEEEIRLLKSKVAELEKKLEGKKTSTEESAVGKSEASESAAKNTVDPVKIKARCDELEASMEQLSKEYEACEDYWQSKLNEERQLYEEEQRIADDKFNELLKKMAEYEEQFAGQASSGSKSEDGRLSPIEEKDVLEQQYLDLEAEFQQAQQMLEEKSHEVEKFRCRILELEQLVKYPSEAMLATPPRIETPEIEESPASSPISYLWSQSTIQAPATTTTTTTTRDYQNPNWCQPLKVTTSTQQQNSSCNEDQPSKDQLTVEEEPVFSRTISPIQKPASAHSTTDVTSCGGDAGQDLGDCSDVCSVKSARSTHSLASTHSIHKSVSQTDVAMVSQEQLKHQRLMQLQLQDEIKELTHQRDCLKMEFQQMTEVKPFLARSYNKTAHPNLTQKIQHLENKNRHLNGMLKQQQAYSEQILHRIWQHQRSEIAEMSNRLEAQSIVIADQAKRLASNDILVKDLYVENTHLAATVQRLEQQKVRATLLQQYTQAAASGSGHHPHPQLSGIVPGMP